MTRILYFLIPFFTLTLNAQVGIGTELPQAALDISATNAGVFLPRIALTSLTTAAPVTNPNSGAVVDGTMIWNTGAIIAPAGIYYWQSGKWNQLVNNEQQVFVGRMVVSAADFAAPNRRKTIAGIPFSPRTIEFTAISNTEVENGNYITSTNANNKDNSVGYTFGYAKIITTTPFIEQIAISGAGSGASINRVGNYSSIARCFAAQFVNQDAVNQGRTSASMFSFNPNGFALTIEEFTDPIVVIYKAYKY